MNTHLCSQNNTIKYIIIRISHNPISTPKDSKYYISVTNFQRAKYSGVFYPFIPHFGCEITVKTSKIDTSRVRG